MMYDSEKSDPGIVAEKRANKDAPASAELVERRAGPEGKPGRRATCRAQKRASVQQAADRIRAAAKRNPGERLVALLHHVSVPALRVAYFSIRKDAASGVDGITWLMYGNGLDDRLADLHDRVHSGAYRAPPSRRVFIPKDDGGQRPLGIASLEDKILQKAVTDQILVPIYETEFLGFSDGFRPGRGAHNALDALTVGIEQRKVNWILDADIRAFFDTLSRDWMIQFLEHRIGDKRVLRLIAKWLGAGVMDGTEWSDTGMGPPQGGIISPCLANIYLHYAFDLWVHQIWRGRKATGDMIVVRYADDFVVGFQFQQDADRFLSDLTERMASFGLALHPDKTRLIEFGRHAPANRAAQGTGKPDTFDFLGMTHYCDKTRRGRFRVGRKPSRKRVRRTLNRIREALRSRRHLKAKEISRWLGRVINGWLNYFAVPGSFRDLKAFVHAVKRLLHGAMRRRSQRDRTPWSAVERLVGYHWPKITIRHPWPSQRLSVATRGRSPVR